jgi:hypothetical protein
MHDLLFDNQAHLKLNQLRGYADQLQLDLPRFSAEMDDHVYLQRIREHMQSGRESGVRGTPTFFVNRRIQDVVWLALVVRREATLTKQKWNLVENRRLNRRGGEGSLPRAAAVRKSQGARLEWIDLIPCL